MARPPQPGDEGCQRVACHPLTNLFRTAPKPKETVPGGAALASAGSSAAGRWECPFCRQKTDGIPTMFWNRAMETIRGDDLLDLQIKRLKWSLHQAGKTGLYQRRMKEAGVSPDDIKTLEDVERLPFTTKKDLQAGYPFGLFAVPMKEVVRIHTPSGTTGKPTVVGYTRQDLENWSELIARNMTMIGLEKTISFRTLSITGSLREGSGSTTAPRRSG